jgi:hypothetical protein
MTEDTISILTHIGSGIVGGLIVALIQSLMSRSSDRVLKQEADIKADRLEFVPMIERFIARAAEDPAPNSVRRDSIRELRDWKRRFSLHLSGRRLAAFSKAWTALEQTTENEMVGTEQNRHGVFTNPQDPEFIQISQLLSKRLEALRDTVNDA